MVSRPPYSLPRLQREHVVGLIEKRLPIYGRSRTREILKFYFLSYLHEQIHFSQKFLEENLPVWKMLKSGTFNSPSKRSSKNPSGRMAIVLVTFTSSKLPRFGQE